MNETNARQRAEALLQTLSTEEKLRQLTADMLFDVTGDYETRRDPLCGSYRNPGHFMHYKRETPASPAEVARRIARDVSLSVKAQPHGIPPIENGEALHSAQWGMGTNFPQPIGLASSFDPAMTRRVATAIGAEVAAVGVRQVFAPVVNLVRDCRWGRTVETFGEDVRLVSDMGEAMVRGFEENGVIATPKHFADNYAAGGRDSNYSDNSERTLREVFLPPFKACFDAGAGSVMAAYNGWEGLPCSANPRLLTEILRGEWGFGGFVVSDYGGVEGLETAHRLADSPEEAAAMALKAGLDVILPFNSIETLREAMRRGLLTEEDIDKNVLRVLTAKFRIGLFDDPAPAPEKADALVRCAEHRALALEAARETIVLLKNEGVLPLQNEKIRRLGVFGQSADLIPIGSNYSGPYGTPWVGDDAPTPLQALREYLGDGTEIITGPADAIETLAPTCDACLYFTAIVEGEGSDRSDLRLPRVTVHTARETDGGVIVDAGTQEIREDQEDAILRLCRANANTAVILLNGAPVDMTAWIGETSAVIEAWYPGEQGARALTEILFGVTNPSGRLPICIPKHVGQLPLFYARKPSGRGVAYCDDDGRPLYPFGYGLSYTTFAVTDPALTLTEDGAAVSCTVTNTGGRDGTEVLQLYVASHHCAVMRPEKELKAYVRVTLQPGASERVTLTLPQDALCYYDARLRFGLHDGRHTLLLARSAEETLSAFELTARDGRLLLPED